MEHQYLLTLRGKDGTTPTALLRLKQGKAGYQAERRDYVPLPREAALWLFMPGGPVPAGTAKPGPVLGAALVEKGRCLCAGAVKGTKTDLPREVLRLRLLLQAELAEREKPASGIEAAFSEGQSQEPEAIEAAMAEPVVEQVQPEPPTEIMKAEDDPTGAQAPSETAEACEEEPTVPVMAILAAPEEENPEVCGCETNVIGKSVLKLHPDGYEYEDSRYEIRATEESYSHIPEGAEEVSGREYGWTFAEEEERRAIWIAGETTIKTNAEYDVNLEMERTEDEEFQAGRSDALQDILARAERAFSDHVPPSPTPMLTEGVEIIAGPAADPVQAREGLAMAIPNPFPNTFPGAEFRRVHRPQGQGWYLQGEMRRGNERWRITAMPGEYRPIPPCALQGFHRYIKSRDGGYWLRIERG